MKISVQPHTPVMFTWPTFNAPVCPKAQIWKCSTHCFCDGSKVDPKAAPESSLSVFFRRFFPGVQVAGRDINRLGLLCDCIEEKAQIIQWQEKEDKWKTASMGGGGKEWNLTPIGVLAYPPCSQEEIVQCRTRLHDR